MHLRFHESLNSICIQPCLSIKLTNTANYLFIIRLTTGYSQQCVNLLDLFAANMRASRQLCGYVTFLSFLVNNMCPVFYQLQLFVRTKSTRSIMSPSNILSSPSHSTLHPRIYSRRLTFLYRFNWFSMYRIHYRIRDFFSPL